MLTPFQKTKVSLNLRKKNSNTKKYNKPSLLTTFKHLYPVIITKNTNKAVMSICPFHDENNPSFAMYSDTNTYYCFACNEHGNAYSLIMKSKNINFKEAVEYAELNNLL